MEQRARVELGLAIAAGDAASVRRLVAEGAPADSTLLPAALEELFNAKNPRFRQMVGTPPGDELLAEGSARLDILECLLDAGAPLDDLVDDACHLVGCLWPPGGARALARLLAAAERGGAAPPLRLDEPPCGPTAMHAAIDDDNGEVLALLLARGGDVNARSGAPDAGGPPGESLFLAAAAGSAVACLHVLLDAGGVDVTPIDDDGGEEGGGMRRSGLHYLVLNHRGGESALAALVARTLAAHPHPQAAACAEDGEGVTPLGAALRGGHVAVALALLQGWGAAPSPRERAGCLEALLSAHAALPPASVGLAARLVQEHGARRSACRPARGGPFADDRALLSWAVAQGDPATRAGLLRLLLPLQSAGGGGGGEGASGGGGDDAGGSAHSLVNTHDGADGAAPLLRAAGAGHADAVAACLRAGARLDAANARGETALHAAAAGGHEGCVAALLACGARVAPRDARGRTPLDMAPEGAAGADVRRLLLQLEAAQGAAGSAVG